MTDIKWHRSDTGSLVAYYRAGWRLRVGNLGTWYWGVDRMVRGSWRHEAEGSHRRQRTAKALAIAALEIVATERG